MRFGGMIDTERLEYPSILGLTKAYERLGFDHVGVFDHVMPIYSGDDAAVSECWTTLAALARDTTSIRLGPLVNCVYYRNPVLVAKMASGIDNLSDGRAFVGIGLGWLEKDFQALGLQFGSFSERRDRASEFAEILVRLWTENSVSYSGRYFSFQRAASYPKPRQKPYPPLLMGSETGGAQMLKLIAKTADIANVGWNMPLETLRAKFSELDEDCNALGRKPGSIARSTNFDLLLGSSELEVKAKVKATQEKFQGRFEAASFEEKIKNGMVGTPEQCAPKLEALEKMGVELVFFQPLDSPDTDSAELFADAFLRHPTA